MLLGDLGADVVKVEHNGAGDDARTRGLPSFEGKSRRDPAPLRTSAPWRVSRRRLQEWLWYDAHQIAMAKGN